MNARAQIAFGATTIDCVVLDVSTTGARLQLLAPKEAEAVPELAALRFADGATHGICRRWRQGPQVGVEFVGPDTLGNQEHLRRVTAAHHAMRTGNTAEVVRIVRAARFFGDAELHRAAAGWEMAQEELRRVALESEAALSRLEAALRRHPAAMTGSAEEAG